MPPHRFTTHLVTWQASKEPLHAIRSTVFIQEQGVPQDLEWDGEDARAIHALARDAQGLAIGTARLLLHGDLAHIGRMAVLKPWRGRGVGSALLACLLAEAQRRGAISAFLNAQTDAVPFYTRAGFTREGAEFFDAGIPHYRMTRGL